MPKLVEMDDMVTLHHQMGQDVGPVILINTFRVTPAEVDQLLTAWAADAAWMKRQPGFISTQLHRGIRGVQPRSGGSNGFAGGCTIRPSLQRFLVLAQLLGQLRDAHPQCLGGLLADGRNVDDRRESPESCATEQPSPR